MKLLLRAATSAFLLSIACSASTRSVSAASISRICDIQRSITVTTDFRGLAAHVSEVCRSNPDVTDPGFWTLLSEVQEILQKVNGDLPINPQGRPKLEAETILDIGRQVDEKLDEVAKILTTRNRRFTSPLAKGERLMQSLMEDFPDPSSRLANGKAYVARLKELIATTETGKKVLQCWEDSSRNDAFAGEELFVMPPPTPPGSSAMCSIRPVTAHLPGGTRVSRIDYPQRAQGKPQFLRSIQIAAQDDPVQTAMVLAHELKHGCDTAPRKFEVSGKLYANRWKQDLLEARMDPLLAQEFLKGLERSRAKLDPTLDGPAIAELDRRIRKLESVILSTKSQAEGKTRLPDLNKKREELLQEEKELIKIKTADALVDEMRAYTVTANIFKELAARSPGFVCNYTYRSGLWGSQLITTAEYHSTLENKLRDGTYVHFLVEQYFPEHRDFLLPNGNQSPPTEQVRKGLEEFRKSPDSKLID